MSGPQDTLTFAREIGQRLSAISDQVRPTLVAEVNDIIAQADSDTQRIEHCLDALLEYAFDDKILVLFKQLCRYYWHLDPTATAQQIGFYREMWDSADVGADDSAER